MIDFQCQMCGVALGADETFIGKKVVCHGCKRVLIVPGRAEAMSTPMDELGILTSAAGQLDRPASRAGTAWGRGFQKPASGFPLQRVFAIVACLIGMMGVFLPWMDLGFITISGIKTIYSGWTFCSLAASALLFGFGGNNSRPLEGGGLAFGIIPALASSGIAIWQIIDFCSRIQSPAGGDGVKDVLNASGGIGIGLYFIAISGIVAAIIAITVRR